MGKTVGHNHSKNREKVCLNCLYKASDRATKNEIKLFKDNYKPDYDPSLESMPLGICLNCRLHLVSKDDGRGNFPLLKTGNYDVICTPGK